MACPKKGLQAASLWPDGGDLEFIVWQKKQSVKVSPLKKYISGAEEYHRYMSRNRATSTGSFSISSLIAFFLRATLEPKQPECGHELHPSAAVETFCPVCQVDHCIAFLDAISEAWEAAGGPFRGDYEPKSYSHRYINLRRGWRVARLELINLVAKLEKQAIMENRMDFYTLPAETLDEPDDSLPIVYGTQAALIRYRLAYKYPAVNVTRQIEDDWHTPGSSLRQKKEVHFDKDLVDGSTRKYESFNRKHPDYVRGPHSVSPGSQFENTTCTHDVEVLVAQSKIFFTSMLGFKVFAEKPTHWPEFEGIAGCHPRWEEILVSLGTYAFWRSRRKFGEWEKKLESSGVDGIAIVENHGRIVDFVVLKAPKENLHNPIKRNANWVSLSDAESEERTFVSVPGVDR
ncbi:uncharacterized protein CC84DRAFT_1239055 [Paraphaeosphaeria sporulosa]|uniref:Uncharacterized protein n=1 Tax=Paraphaeosphaeria sporulosa TaxID=1460663 RepID=A0A177CMD6_9PLEO|nr:uncharacterized protein CC84DRAFT_1239055 [Paraphaeosphaeria sporulosa]OAG07969.1 hypothetical protein CC84DRAFT_1239055 [Paraphaeosphaeria sporulosa]